MLVEPSLCEVAAALGTLVIVRVSVELPTLMATLIVVMPLASIIPAAPTVRAYGPALACKNGVPISPHTSPVPFVYPLSVVIIAISTYCLSSTRPRGHPLSYPVQHLGWQPIWLCGQLRRPASPYPLCNQRRAL